MLGWFQPKYTYGPFLLNLPPTPLVSPNSSDWWCWFSHQVVSDSCDPVDCSLPDSSVHGILQARILEWVANSFSSKTP